jgi:hypothetical protein
MFFHFIQTKKKAFNMSEVRIITDVAENKQH